MEKCSWLDDITHEIVLPIKIHYDSAYLTTLIDTFKKIYQLLEKGDAPKVLLETAKDYGQKIINSIDTYYKGGIIEAHNIVFELIKNACDNNKYAVSDINSSIAFPVIGDNVNTEVQFFRARLSESVVNYSASEMLHIPFSKRAFVKSERFSIPGLPCLYLGNTSYVCWLEMGRPADHRFNVSPFVLDNSQKVFNLAISTNTLYFMVDSVEDTEHEKKLCDLFKLYLLSVGTSFVVSESNRNFKSEYILSQMIMLACKRMGLQGITYFTKKVCHEAFANILGVNLALFADYETGEDISSICEHIKNDESFNYSMFKQLNTSLKYKGYDLRIDKTIFYRDIGNFSKNFPYNETQFYEFDKFLFANWSRT